MAAKDMCGFPIAWHGKPLKIPCRHSRHWQNPIKNKNDFCERYCFRTVSFFVQKEGRGVCVFVLRGFFAVSGGWWRVERRKKGGGRKNVETAGGRICEKTLKNRHFLKKKRRKKQVVGLVFLLRLYYNVVSSGEKWLKRE